MHRRSGQHDRGLDEILTVVPLRLPKGLRWSLPCTNSAENMMGTIRRVRRNAKRWRDAGMALGRVAAGMIEASKGLRPLKAYKQLAIVVRVFELTTIA